MEITARLNYHQCSSRKARLAVWFIRGMDIETARQQLVFSQRGASRPVLKLLNSALANAEKNFELKKENLFIKNLIINEGPTLKRYRPRAFGRAALLRKRSCHITLVLAEKKPTQSKKKETAKTKIATQPAEVVSYADLAKETPAEKKTGYQAAVKAAQKPFLRIKEIKDKFIRRTGKK